jgi:beta-fructofuranosidase
VSSPPLIWGLILMSLRLEDKWLWDFWLTRDGPDFHIFYLQAPRDLGDAELRHWNVSMGHAVSQDLVAWEILPDALRPSNEGSGAWDDCATWTGSIIQKDGLCFMFYTGCSRSDGGLVQRIGLATSDDLLEWRKFPENPVITCDPRWYELLDLGCWHDQAWRDPWIFKHPYAGDFHALITARSKHGPPDSRGVIAHARSDDLLRWEVLAPVCEPGLFGHMEVPQLIEIESRFYLLFSATKDVLSSAWRERNSPAPEAATYYLVGDGPLGPFRIPSRPRMLGSPRGDQYSGKLIKGPAGVWQFLAYRHRDGQGHFIGELDNPIPIRVGDSGKLHLENDAKPDGLADATRPS